MALLLRDYFEEVEIVPNHYTTGNGVLIGSIYGVGRVPRAAAAPNGSGKIEAKGSAEVPVTEGVQSTR
jgi:hypothetical protein